MALARLAVGGPVLPVRIASALPNPVGLAGLVVGRLVREIVIRSRAPGRPALPATALALAYGAGLLAHALFGLADAVALGARPGFTMWLLLGLLAGL
jgi:hypothetical protein